MKKLLPAKQFKEIKNALKETKQGELVKTVNARDVHAWLGVKTPFHKWIKRRIDSLMLIDQIDYITTTDKIVHGQETNYHMTPDTVKLLAMGEDGEKGKLVKLYFIDCETIAKSKLDELELRRTSRVEFRPMTDAIAEAHEDPQAYHYSNECDMINRIVLGMTSAKFKAFHGLESDEATRDYLTKEQQKAVIELQRANTVLIKFGKSFQERKEELQTYFDKNHADKLLEEVKSIHS